MRVQLCPLLRIQSARLTIILGLDLVVGSMYVCNVLFSTDTRSLLEDRRGKKKLENLDFKKGAVFKELSLCLPVVVQLLHGVTAVSEDGD